MTANAAGRRLIQLSNGGGCACKVPQALMKGVLATVRAAGEIPLYSRLLIGLDQPDDAAVVQIDATRAWVLTCDFMPPVVDDARAWGRIAAVNALSDVYAMGGRPLFALNLLCWPADLPSEMLAEVLGGGSDAVREAGALVIGGHSLVDPVPKYGLVAIGEADPRRLLTKGGARAGDLLVLTKALGTGAVGTALKKGEAPVALLQAAIDSMSRLNASASRIAVEEHLSGGTDVTGYGLLGHLREMAVASGLGAQVWLDRLPVLAGAMELIGAGFAPDGSRRTLDNALGQGWFEPGTASIGQQLLLADAQTSGGLLLAVPAEQADRIVARLRQAGDAAACVVGGFVGDGCAGVVRAEGSVR